MPLILIVIGLFLIIYNYKDIKKENEMEPKENIFNTSFQSVLEDNKEELNDYKMEIGILRRDIAESLTELQEEIVDIKSNLNKLKNNEEMYDNEERYENDHRINSNENNDTNYNNINENPTSSNMNNEYNKDNYQKVEESNQSNEIVEENLFVDLDIADGIISEINFSKKADSSKTQNIKRLLREGLTEDEICHELSVSKGEVLLVKGLFKK